MYWREHFPEHFHVEYGEFKAIVSIKNGAVIKGMIPAKQLKLTLAWAELHKEELIKNWNHGINNEEFSKIEPLK